MNYKLITILAGAALGMSITSCSDKDPKPLPDLGTQKTYTGTDLQLSYNGELMPGKTAKVKIEGGKAEITFSCAFDLSQLTGMGLTGALQGPGVTPGDPILILTTDAIPGDGEYSVAGSGSTENVTFSYNGTLTDKVMNFNITDCKLKNQALAGNVFVPAPLKKDGFMNYSSMPFHLKWEIDPAIGIDIPLTEILKVIVTSPIIPVYNNTAYTSLSEAFANIVKTVALTDSGNIPVMYVSTLGGAAHIATSSGTMMQYIPAGDGMKLYLNPLSVVGEVLLATSDNKNDEKFDFDKLLKKAQRESDSASDSTGEEISPELKKALIEVVLKAFAPQLANGIPLTVEPTAAGADIYLDTATSVTFLSTILQDALQNPTIAAALQKALESAQIPELDPAQAGAILQQLPQILINSTRLEIGLSFVKK